MHHHIFISLRRRFRSCSGSSRCRRLPNPTGSPPLLHLNLRLPRGLCPRRPLSRLLLHSLSILPPPRLVVVKVMRKSLLAQQNPLHLWRLPCRSSRRSPSLLRRDRNLHIAWAVAVERGKASSYAGGLASGEGCIRCESRCRASGYAFAVRWVDGCFRGIDEGGAGDVGVSGCWRGGV